METAQGSIVPRTGAGADTLARLREQRWLLAEVRDAVDAAGRRMALRSSDGAWRSPAERAYRGRLTELTGELMRAWRALDDAVSAVDAALLGAEAAS